MYILEPGMIEEIPKDKFYNITDLILKLQQEGRKVGVFPISQNSWIDIGDWNQYSRFLENFKS